MVLFDGFVFRQLSNSVGVCRLVVKLSAPQLVTWCRRAGWCIDVRRRACLCHRHHAGGPPVELGELRQALYTTQPGAVLVQPRILRRMLRAEFKVPHLLIQAPHEKCYFFDRQVLFREVEQDELDLQADHALPPTVILLARPSAEELQDLDNEALLLQYWQLLFHAQVHLALHRRFQSGVSFR